MHISPEERPPRPAAAREVLAGTAVVHLRALARVVGPRAPALERLLLRNLRSLGYDAPRRKALAAISPASAAIALASRRSAARFLEEVEDNGRRLAKLNVPPGEVVEALRHADRLLDPVVGDRFQPAREQLHMATVLALNNAFFDVREAETQAFFGLARAEAAARDTPDLLRLFARVLARVFGARAAGLSLPAKGAPADRRVPRYLASPRSLLDARLHPLGRSAWSFPIPAGNVSAGVIELVFPGSHRWLPREAELLRAAAERCGKAVERARLLEQMVRLGAAARQAEKRERHRLSRELHDDTAQSLMVLRLQLELLARQVPAEMSGRLAQMRESVERAIADLRRVIAALSPDTLDRLGLEAAIRHLAGRSVKAGGAKVRVRVSPGSSAVPTEAAETVYRVAQESLQNISRHSQATHVNLWLRCVDRKVKLSVVDNGVGFDAEAALRRPLSFGLAGMRERAVRSGGTLEIRSAPGKGASVTLVVPLPPGRTKDHGKDSNSTHR